MSNVRLVEAGELAERAAALVVSPAETEAGSTPGTVPPDPEPK